MLKTMRLSFKILALGYSVFSSLMDFQLDFSVSRYQDFNCSSQSPCFSQNSLKVRFAKILKFFRLVQI